MSLIFSLNSEWIRFQGHITTRSRNTIIEIQIYSKPIVEIQINDGIWKSSSFYKTMLPYAQVKL
jgi:hypothetical protein